VEATERSRYDVIFMDQHMPVMDGLAATAEIRRREDQNQRNVIVALTASALPEDRTRCLESGMDDFIAKPVARAALSRVLRRWVRERTAAVPPESVPAEA